MKKILNLLIFVSFSSLATVYEDVRLICEISVSMTGNKFLIDTHSGLSYLVCVEDGEKASADQARASKFVENKTDEVCSIRHSSNISEIFSMEGHIEMTTNHKGREEECLFMDKLI